MMIHLHSMVFLMAKICRVIEQSVLQLNQLYQKAKKKNLSLRSFFLFKPGVRSIGELFDDELSGVKNPPVTL
jgi:hypothetical protein